MKIGPPLRRARFTRTATLTATRPRTARVQRSGMRPRFAGHPPDSVLSFDDSADEADRFYLSTNNVEPTRLGVNQSKS